jgi:small GTP-binding protein
VSDTASVLQKKICMVGSFAVGKTSLVSRFVHSIFSEKYLTTIGVKVDRKDVAYSGGTLRMLLWDLAGEDDYAALQMSYLRGSSALLFVADGTRKYSLQKVDELKARVFDSLGELPCVLVINKSDMKANWEITEADIAERRASGMAVFEASAKLGEGVEECFQGIVQALKLG